MGSNFILYFLDKNIDALAVPVSFTSGLMITFIVAPKWHSKCQIILKVFIINKIYRSFALLS
jgi:hypothetical protein